MLLFFLACSDYALNQKTNTEPGAVGEPESTPIEEPYIVVDPMQITVRGLCGNSYDTEVVILNAGGSDLIISDMEVQAAGWSIIEPSYPLILAPGQMHTLPVHGSVGAGLISIYSNDPNEPSLWIEVNASGDIPPSVSILEPLDGSILPVEGSTFTAQIQDHEDNLQDLVVSWYSDADGFLGVSSVDAMGNSIISNILPSAGAQELSAVVMDSCGQEGFDAVGVCQQQGYETDNLDISSWNFEGSAQWDASLGVVELTAPVTNVAGTAFSTAAVINAQYVDIEFLFYASGGSGADGFSLTALDANRMTGFVGSTGGGIGYGGMPGWSIEVDTYYNSTDPTSEDHVAFAFDGNVNAPVIWAAIPDMEDGQWHSMHVTVSDPHILVEIDGVAYLNQDISGNLNFSAYVGFTAATGSLTNYHRIDSLVVTEEVCSE